jgi:hypothetical protein
VYGDAENTIDILRKTTEETSVDPLGDYYIYKRNNEELIVYVV